MGGAIGIVFESEDAPSLRGEQVGALGVEESEATLEASTAVSHRNLSVMSPPAALAQAQGVTGQGARLGQRGSGKGLIASEPVLREFEATGVHFGG